MSGMWFTMLHLLSTLPSMPIASGTLWVDEDINGYCIDIFPAKVSGSMGCFRSSVRPSMIGSMRPSWRRSRNSEPQSPIYFDRREVKEAIHAPVDTEWLACSNIEVFPNQDSSLPSAITVLPNVIEKNQRTVIAHGLADFVLMADGYDFIFDPQSSYILTHGSVI